MQQVHIRVRGHVQGVGFRWFVQTEAEARQLTGEVRNLRDGTVEIHVQGERAALEQFIAVVRQGSSGARVSDASATWSDTLSQYRGFRIAF